MPLSPGDEAMFRCPGSGAYGCAHIRVCLVATWPFMHRTLWDRHLRGARVHLCPKYVNCGLHFNADGDKVSAHSTRMSHFTTGLDPLSWAPWAFISSADTFILFSLSLHLPLPYSALFPISGVKRDPNTITFLMCGVWGQVHEHVISNSVSHALHVCV